MMKKIQYTKANHIQKEKQLAVLFQVVSTTTSLDLDQVLSQIVKIVTKLLKADSTLVYLLDHKKEELTLRASKNPHKEVMGSIKMRMGEGITGWVAQHRRPIAIGARAGSDKRFKLFQNLPEDLYEAFLSVPIVTKKGVVGVINVQHEKPRKYTVSEVELLVAIGKLVGGSVENAQLIEESLTLKEILETRKLVDRAKGILMKRLQIDEDMAYRKMQKQSMNLRKSIREIADAIVLSEHLTGN